VILDDRGANPGVLRQKIQLEAMGSAVKIKSLSSLVIAIVHGHNIGLVFPAERNDSIFSLLQNPEQNRSVRDLLFLFKHMVFRHALPSQFGVRL
jgi:hypothetical protein